MGKGDTSINYPTQPTYGEGMREALEAQVALLTGEQVGDANFSQFEGGLKKLVEEYEAPLRKSTAQIDTDVLRQTLLGDNEQVVLDEATGKYGIPGGQVVTNAEGDVLTASGGRYQMVQLDSGIEPQSMGLMGDRGDPNAYFPGRTARFAIVDTETGGITSESGGELFLREGMSDVTKGVAGEYFDSFVANKPKTPSGTVIDFSKRQSPMRLPRFEGLSANDVKKNIDKDQSLLELGTQRASKEMNRLRDAVAEGSVSTKFDFTNPNIPADPSKAGQPGYDDEGRTLLQEGDIVRKGDGMIDLLGDKRNVQETRKLNLSEQGEAFVNQNPELDALYQQAEADPTNPFFGLSKAEAGRKLLEDFDSVEDIASAFGIDKLSLPTVAAMDTGRQAGFDAQGNFLGLSALAEDIQAGNLSRQRERDLADVERLSDRFQDVMEDFRPGTAEAVTGARDVLESQRQNLTGQRPATAADVAAGDATEVGQMISTGRGLITVPTTDTFGGLVLPATLTAATLGEGPTLDAETSFDAFDPITRQTLTAETSFDPSADVQGGLIIADPLRQALMEDAEAALGQGLTAREERQIAEAARARATMMGRTFDQSEAIREAEARVLEDNARRMQNRAFAQGVLGQEAGLQESDLSRTLQAKLANQQATNQAKQFAAQAGISQEEAQARLVQQAELADLGAEQQRRQILLQAGMQQDAQQAEIDQQRDILQAQLNQQGAAFDAEAAQQAATATQRQRQQASQFGVGAQMDAERLNAQLAQQGALGYVDAATRLAALEDKTTLDPFAALLNRAGGGSLGQAGQVFGQANYGLSSGPQFLNPESGLGFISQMAANEASMYGAQQAANAAKTSGLYQGIGSALGGAFGMFNFGE